MKDPCKTCINYSQEKIGIRTFIGCKDDEKRKGFKYDSFMYEHSCINHELRNECSECTRYSSPYCRDIYAISESGKCGMGIQIIQ